MRKLITCPVCGVDTLGTTPYAIWPPPPGVEIAPPYYLQLGDPSYEVCVRCGYEFGQDDHPWADEAGDSFEEYRAEWEANGKPWLSQRAKQRFEAERDARNSGRGEH